MRSFIFLFCIMTFGFTPKNGNGQNAKIRIDSDRTISIEEVFDLIKDQTKYKFIYSTDLFENSSRIFVKKGKIKTNVLLQKSLVNSNLSYDFIENTIVLTERLTTEIEEPKELIQQTITGTVTDVDSNPIVGVNVLVGKGSSFRGVATDFEGKYSINVIKGDVIRFSYLGYKTEEIIFENQTTINVILEEDTALLDEVVLIGYGTSKKEDLVGSVGSVDMKGFTQVSQPSIESSLAGRLAGVHVSRSGGAPGDRASIQIRGFSSFSGTNEPLYVIDGIPHQGGDDNPLNFLNPDDIEKIDVLKDASSAAIYGSRAANGVILIQTKRGKAGKPKMEFSLSSNFQSISKKYDVLNRDQFLDVAEESTIAAGQPFDRANFDLGGDTDWQDEGAKTAIYKELYLGLSGGISDSKTVYSLGLSVTDQAGIVEPAGYKRYTGRLTIEGSPLKGVLLGTSINYSNTETIRTRSGFYRIAFTRPDLPVDEVTSFTGSNPNYIRSNEISTRDGKNNIAFGSVFGELEIIDNLKFRSTFSFTSSDAASVRFTPSFLSNNGVAVRYDSSSTSKTLIWDNTVSYNTVFNDVHSLDILGGVSWTNIKNENLSITSQGFPDDTILINLGSANSITRYDSGAGESGLASYFLRTKYDFSNKYYFIFTGRTDRSTKFGPDNQWGFFPSGGVGWKISDETFMEESIFDFLKLKTSVGLTGLASFGDFQYLSIYEPGAFYDGINGITPGGLPNPKIKWEKTKQTDIALEFEMFNNRFGGEIGYYKKYTSDMIMRKPIPVELGGGSFQIANVGDVSNKGFEITLHGTIIDTDDFSWNSNFNITFQKNRIEKLADGFIGGTFGQPVDLEVGDSFGTISGFLTNGLIRSQEQLDDLNAGAPDGIYRRTGTGIGDRLFVDVDGDGEITSEDVVKLGSSTPDYYGGFTNVFKYKDFELSAFFNFAYGNSGVPNSLRTYSYGGTTSGNTINNWTTRVLDAWSPSNPDGKWPRNILNDPNGNNTFADVNTSDASYIKLKNVQLSYKLPLNFNAMVFVSATNLFTITNWKGQDPEEARMTFDSIGAALGQSPYTTTFSIGLKTSF